MISRMILPFGRCGRFWESWKPCFVVMLLMVDFIFPLPGLAVENVSLTPGAIEPSATTTKDFLEALKTSPTKTLHGLAKFPRHLSQKERARLARSGIQILEPYYKTTYWVSVTNPAKSRKDQILKTETTFARLRPQDRVDPYIWEKEHTEFLFAPPGGQSTNYVVNADETLNLTVHFHADVSEAQANKLIQRLSKKFTKKNPGTWVVNISKENLHALANEDIVQLIDEGPQPLLPENDHTRAGIGVDLVQKFDPTTGHGPGSGSGVRIGVFDSGIDEDHPDLNGRIIVSSAGKNHHATTVAGTIAASGVYSAPNGGSAYQWRGMAPEVELYDEPDSVGDNKSVHESLIRDPGMHLSNHSYGININGRYTVSNKDRDEIIRGIRPHYRYPRLHVYSAGNYGCVEPPGQNPTDPIRCMRNGPQTGYQTGYFSLTKQLKNGLVVGNWNHAGTNENNPRQNQIYHTSSLGPTHDGRIKPDVVAPGTDIRSTQAYTSNYGFFTGTSAAAATVTGMLSLLLQEYGNSYGVDLNNTPPLPSTLRSLVIHTADDVSVDPCPLPQTTSAPWFVNADGPVKPTCGPDFVTGWGIVNAENAVEKVTNKLLLEDTVEEECVTKTYLFDVATASPIRVTLAWDDLPYSGPSSPRTLPKLHNDLDLILIDPNGQRHYPWKLDQTIVDSNSMVVPDHLQSCAVSIEVRREFLPTSDPVRRDDPIPSGGIPSAVRGRDHLNNVEVIDALPIPGTWTAQVIGFSVSYGPQPFSLVGYDFYDAASR